MKHNGNLYLAIIGILLSVISCAKDVDFNQINDVEIAQKIAVDLVYFKESANNYQLNGASQEILKEKVFIGDLFKTKATAEYIVKLELVIEISNSVDRSGNMRVNFYNSANANTYSESIPVEASPNNEILVKEHTIVFEGASLNAIKQSEYAEFVFSLNSGTPISNTTKGMIQLKSKAIIYTLITDL